MEKEQLINEILNYNAQSVYYIKGEFWGNREYDRGVFDWEMPCVKYIINNSKYLGIDGGPSPIDLWEYDFKWNIKKLRKTPIDELEKLLQTINNYKNIYDTLFKKYGNMSLCEFLKSMSPLINT